MSTVSENAFRNKVKRRSLFLKKARRFFYDKNILEVDCPILSPYPAVDAYIDSFKTASKPQFYLSTSPEYYMKKLLSQGSGDIFQISHVFRDEPSGPLHQPEFSMAEWYRTELSYQDLIDETFDFICIMTNKDIPLVKTTYQNLFLDYCKIDPLTATSDILYDYCICNDLIPYSREKDDILDIILNAKIIPKISKNQFLSIDQYPISQAALARQNPKTLNTAYRFEIFYGPIELANGYWELNDMQVQKNRFETENKKRAANNKDIYPIDEAFLKALPKLPNCVGVAVGLDRLYLIAESKKSLDNALFFPHKNH